jgi:hypothetical protein
MGMRAPIAAVAAALICTSVAHGGGAPERGTMIWKQPRPTMMILDGKHCGDGDFDGTCADVAFDCDPYAERQMGEVTLSVPLSRVPKAGRAIHIKLSVRAKRSAKILGTFSYRAKLDPFADTALVTTETTIRDPLFKALREEGTLIGTYGGERREAALDGMAEMVDTFLYACAGVTS